MDVGARVTSKGQVTIPRAVREALGLGEGDHVVFRVEGRRAVLARTPDLLDLAGAVEVPAEKQGRRGTRSAAGPVRPGPATGGERPRRH
jgi:antitoxin PrlF